MRHLLRHLDPIPLAPLCILALVVGMAPFSPEPHLLEKLRMLSEGTLRRPIDIFDLFYHLLPLILLALKGVRQLQRSRIDN